MFSKKFLSFIALVFVGSQISSVSAGFTECTATEKGYTASSDCDPQSYCIDGQLIYGINTSPTCKIALNGVYVFNDNDGTINDLSGDIESSKANIAIYNCNGTTCAKTTGFIKDDDAYYIVGTTGGASTDNVAINIADTDCTTNADEKIGKLLDDTLCLGSSVTPADADGKRYIMKNVASNAFVSGGSGTNSIVIRTATKIFAYDNLIADDEYCVTSSDNVLTGTLEDFHASEPSSCDAYYNCKSQLCTDVTTASTCTRQASPSDNCVPSTGAECSTGYYVTSDSEGKTLLQDGSAGYLYSCSGSEGACTPETSLVGYVPNKSDFKTVIPYIQCKFASITNGKIVNTCNAITADAISGASTCTSNAGGLITGNRICVDTNTENAVTLQASNTANNGDYFINDVDKNIFVDTTKEDYHVIITIADDKVTLKTYDDPDSRYKYAVKNKIYAKASTNASAGGICENDAKKALVKEFKSDDCEDDKVYYYKLQNN